MKKSIIERLKTSLQNAETYLENSVNPLTVKDGKLGWEVSGNTFVFLHDVANELCKKNCSEGGFTADGDDPCDGFDCEVGALYGAAWYYYNKYQILKKAIKDEINADEQNQITEV